MLLDQKVTATAGINVGHRRFLIIHNITGVINMHRADQMTIFMNKGGAYGHFFSAGQAGLIEIDLTTWMIVKESGLGATPLYGSRDSLLRRLIANVVIIMEFDFRQRTQLETAAINSERGGVS